MSQQYQGKDIRKIRGAIKGDPGYEENQNQVVVTLEDGTEETVDVSDVEDVGLMPPKDHSEDHPAEDHPAESQPEDHSEDPPEDEPEAHPKAHSKAYPKAHTRGK